MENSLCSFCDAKVPSSADKTAATAASTLFSKRAAQLAVTCCCSSSSWTSLFLKVRLQQPPPAFIEAKRTLFGFLMLRAIRNALDWCFFKMDEWHFRLKNLSVPAAMQRYIGVRMKGFFFYHLETNCIEAKLWTFGTWCPLWCKYDIAENVHRNIWSVKLALVEKSDNSECVPLMQSELGKGTWIISCFSHRCYKCGSIFVTTIMLFRRSFSVSWFIIPK